MAKIRHHSYSREPVSRVVIVGGLGSQLFGYAFARYLECVRGHKVVIDTSEIDRGYTKHGVTIESLDLDGEFVNFREKSGKTVYSFQRLYFGISSRLPESISKALPIPVYTAKEIGWSSKHELHRQGTVFRGEYFTAKYFLQLKNMQLDFNFKLKQASPFFSTWDKELHGTKFLSIHVRRGDYKNLSSRFGLLGTEYYRRSLGELVRMGAKWDMVMVFSDEIALAQEVLAPVLIGNDVVYVDPPQGTDPSETMGIMTSATYHVIANSSFSMWGALLSKRAERIIAPSPWFLSSGTPEQLLPKNWVPINGF